MPQCNSGENLVLLASVAAVSLSRELNKDDMILLADFLSTLGSNLALIAAQRDIQEQQVGGLPAPDIHTEGIPSEIAP